MSADTEASDTSAVTLSLPEQLSAIEEIKRLISHRRPTRLRVDQTPHFSHRNKEC